jgi:hypothetical protein
MKQRIKQARNQPTRLATKQQINDAFLMFGLFAALFEVRFLNEGR